MSKIEHFNDEIRRALPPVVAVQVFEAVEMAASRGTSGNAWAVVTMLPELGQQALACVGLVALVEEINGGGSSRAPDTPLEALQRQLVTDEITEAEFEAKRAELQRTGQIDPDEESRRREEHEARERQFMERQAVQMTQLDSSLAKEAA